MPENLLDGLCGKVISGAWVQEMALYGPEGAGCFTDPALAFVQANVLQIRTSDGGFFRFSCCHTDDSWAIWPRPESPDGHLALDPGDGMFRTRAMPEFPTGSVVSVDASPSEDIQEIRIVIDHHEVFLRAGEVYENVDGTLTVCDRDESVLVFLESDAYARQIFNAPVYFPQSA